MLNPRSVRVWLIILLVVLLTTNLVLFQQKTLTSGCVLSSNYDSQPDTLLSAGLQNETQGDLGFSEALTGANTTHHVSEAWSKVAYVQYATDVTHLCNSVMIFESLHRLKSKPDRLLLYPSQYSSEGGELASKLLRKARDEYGVNLMPVELQTKTGTDPTWRDSYTKLLAFNQTQYDRVLSLDSDATILQPMDELFFLPSVPVAMPRAYWLYPEKPILGSHVLLVEPSSSEFRRVVEAIGRTGANEYDMEVLNNLYKDSAMVLPHRQYSLLTGEFRSKSHAAFLGNKEEVFDPEAVLKAAKYVHFSDWPVPKPFYEPEDDILKKYQPKCVRDYLRNTEDCRARSIWNAFYVNFSQRQKAICGDMSQILE